MIITKKHIIYGTLITLGAVLIAVAGAFAIRTFVKPSGEANTQNDSNTSEQKSTGSEQEATASIEEAKKARANHDFTAAIAAYKKARTYYAANDNIEKTADIDVALSLLESEQKNMPVTPKPALAGQE